MKKKLAALFLVMGISSYTVALADDFHRNYRALPSNYISKSRFDDINRIPIPIKLMNSVSTKNNLKEGQKLVFVTTEDTVLKHNKVLPCDSRVFGTIETVSLNERKGVPANIIIGDFKIEYMSNLKIEGNIIKQGANRSLWVMPLLPILYLVKGGHAKINTEEQFTIYYTPQAI